MEISKRQATQIIKTLKSIINEDMNFIYPDGTIIASSNNGRVGTFHEGATIVTKTGDPLIVYEDDIYIGTKKGINLPVYFEDELIAIVGITVTGKFDEVMNLTQIIVKMSEILIKEQFLNTQKQFKRENNRIILELVKDDKSQVEEIVSKMNHLGYSPNIFRYVAVCSLEYFNSEDKDLSNIVYNSIEKRIDYKDLITKSQNELIILSRQNDIDSLISNLEYIQKYIKSKYHINITVGISERFDEIYQVKEAYKQANMVAMVSKNKNPGTIKRFEAASLEFLFFSFSKHVKNSFSNAIIGKIDKNEIDSVRKLFLSYIKNNGSIMKTSQELFIHKNTLQYRLNKIWKVTGYNPRELKDLIILYLALELQRHKDI